ncbi:MAG: metal ABC transporter substrate-binding protein [Pirellulales bacterium]
MNVNARIGRLRFASTLLLAAALSFGSACRRDDPSAPSTASSAERATPPTETLAVVATYSILGDWVARIGGAHVQVAVLVGPGGDAHTYEPTPSDGVALEQARVVFENGLGFEPWLDELHHASRSTALRCVVTQGVPTRSLSDARASRVELDPHVWQSPQRARLVVRNVADQLIAVDPQHASYYRTRLDDYLAELNRLDAEIRSQLEGLPADRRVLVTTHDTFGYFAEDYGFRVSSILGSTSSETSDPSAKDVAAVIRLIREAGVRAVFTENILNPRLTEQVAREAGVAVVPSLYTDALGPAGSSGADYLAMMRSNVRTIVESLR